MVWGAGIAWQLASKPNAKNNQILNKFQDDNKKIWGLSVRQLFTILVALFLAISPWNIHMSHMAYEANLAMFFFLVGLNLFLLATKKITSKTKTETTHRSQKITNTHPRHFFFQPSVSLPLIRFFLWPHFFYLSFVSNFYSADGCRLNYYLLASNQKTPYQ